MSLTNWNNKRLAIWSRAPEPPRVVEVISMCHDYAHVKFSDEEEFKVPYRELSLLLTPALR